MSLESLHLQTHFTSLDWVILVVYLAASVAIGIIANRYITDMADFVVAGRSLRTALAVATMIGSELGLITIMYAAEKGFTGGFAAFHIALAAGVVALVVGLTGFIVGPLRAMGVMTIPEFYERRFGRGARIGGGAILALAGILNMGLFLKAGALFVTGITGLHGSHELKIVMTVLLGLVLFYTILGGMVSVVITDYVQFVVLSIGMLAACAFALRELGWTQIVHGVRTIHGEAGFNPLDNSGFGLDYVLWMFFVAGLVSCAIWQTAVMRACSARDVPTVRRIYLWSSVGFAVRFLIPNFLGLCALVFVASRDDLRGAFFDETGQPRPEQSLAAMPVFLGQILPAGVIGLITAGMLAAFMSTHDSYLLCWSSVLTQDVVAPLFGDRMSVRARLRLTRVFIALIGAFLLVWSLWYPLRQDMWDYMAVTGAIYYTGAFALLVFGLYWRRASRTGAYLALLLGFGAVLGLGPVRTALGVPWSGERVVLATVVGCTAAMIIGSLLFPDRATAQTQETAT